MTSRFNLLYSLFVPNKGKGSRRDSDSTPQEAFRQNYILTANPARAAARAGFAPRMAGKQGSRLLAENRIMARITELRAAIARQHCADAAKSRKWGQMVTIKNQ